MRDTQSQAPGMGPAPGPPRMRLALPESRHEDLCGPFGLHPQARAYAVSGRLSAQVSGSSDFELDRCVTSA